MDTNNYVNNDYLIATLIIFAIVYASQSQVDLPKWLVSLFKNDIFRIIYLSLLLVIPFDKAPHVAILVAVVFVITMKYIGDAETEENFALLMSDKRISRTN